MLKENIAILLDEDSDSAERGGETETPNDHTDLPDHREPNHTVPPLLTSPVAGEQREQNKPSLQGAEGGEEDEEVVVVVEENYEGAEVNFEENVTSQENTST